ncbi:DeoR/GlpR family DNA-binding transcription regulator [Kineosporia succinea]|uniref:DeoR family transcriptional regulator of aga operon n=1 Tax=Kineosporia succinea TaxID=84632 RepID=A0ABT9NXL2_9ACTN|nr:DeoR/GlpR family DNA-binding transcription regulator [Kineosporia succinea]MDP9825168.1 DeoR family transcriptional regulator of aga operon [Kineosporia succinea]
MRRAERLSAILDQVRAEGSVDVGDLSTSLGISGATVRRDLQSLAQNRLLVRTRGGAMSNDVGDELPSRIKASRFHTEKRRIGEAAAALVPEGAVVGLTGGSTALEVARQLARRRGVTIVTNAIDIAGELVGNSGLRVVVIGGILRSSQELVGPAAEAMLSNYHLDIAFIGVDGLTPDEGCTTYDEMEAQTDLAFLRRARRSVVIADSSKLGRVTFARISPLSAVSDVVTDSGAEPGALEALAATGVQVTAV